MYGIAAGADLKALREFAQRIIAVSNKDGEIRQSRVEAIALIAGLIDLKGVALPRLTGEENVR